MAPNFSGWGSGPPLAHDEPTWPLIWIVVYSAAALILTSATLRTFDRCLGRVPESRPARSAPSRRTGRSSIISAVPFSEQVLHVEGRRAKSGRRTADHH